MTKLFLQFKKPYFLPRFFNFGGKKTFSKNIWLCHAQLDKGFYHYAKIQKNLMIQFQEKIQTDGRTSGWTDTIP